MTRREQRNDCAVRHDGDGLLRIAPGSLLNGTDKAILCLPCGLLAKHKTIWLREESLNGRVKVGNSQISGRLTLMLMHARINFIADPQVCGN